MTRLTDWLAEGPVQITEDDDSVILASSADEALVGDHAHWTLWCPEPIEDHHQIEWEFQPISEPGLAMIFFAATGTAGRGLFDPNLQPRNGFYPQYHSGEVQALHLSYFRHKQPDERAFRTCNVRKSPGFHLVAQAADPLPPAADATDFYRLKLIKDGARVSFSINELPVLDWTDDGSLNNGPYGGGHFGFRQMSPLVARYRRLKISRLP